MIDFLLWILLGALAGWIASMIMGTNAQMGMFANIVVGIIGSFIGGFIVSIFTGMQTGGFNLMSLLVAVLGAIILIAIVRMIRGGSPHHA